MQNTILVTGGAGFIGSNFILHWAAHAGTPVINLDKLTYAGNVRNVEQIASDRTYCFVHGDILDQELVRNLFRQHRPRAVLHFAAESHVDRSIHGPDDFIRTNVNGTFSLLEGARAYWSDLPDEARSTFRFLQVSTDEVYGSLGPADPPFREETVYAPNSPYSASKAAADHLVRAYHHTYGLPTLTTNCSNNYGPYQFPEKLIPLMISNAIAGKKLPVYGDGLNVRDWLYVTDHCEAILEVLRKGRPGQTYNIGGCAEMTNLDVVNTICRTLDELRPRADSSSHTALISFVKDRPGHDRRYSLSSEKLARLGWRARTHFRDGLGQTVDWYRENTWWWEPIRSGSYRAYYERQYGRALGG